MNDQQERKVFFVDCCFAGISRFALKCSVLLQHTLDIVGLKLDKRLGHWLGIKLRVKESLSV